MPSSSTIPLLTLTSGTSLPSLAFGTGTALYGRDACDTVLQALNAGFNHVDCAQMYGNESSVGGAVSVLLSSQEEGKPDKKREDIYITTKLHALKEHETVESSLRGSLERLKVSYVDSFLIHVPTAYPGRLAEVWSQMIKVKESGLARSVGVSNFNTSQLREIIEATGVAPAVNQVEFHLLVYEQSKPLLDFHKKHGILTSSYGGLTPILPGRSKEGEVKEVREAKERIVETLDGIVAGRQGGITQNQILLKWLQQKGVLAVTTSSKLSRVQEYLSTPSLPPLTEEETNQLEGAVKGVHYRHFMSFKHMEDV